MTGAIRRQARSTPAREGDREPIASEYLARRDGRVTRLPYLPDGWAEQLEDAGVAFDLGGDPL